MEVLRTPEFGRAFQKLPADAQRLYKVQERRFRENWRDPRLHLSKVLGMDRVLSFRVTRRYRVLFYFRDPAAAVFFDIDHRKDVYR